MDKYLTYSVVERKDPSSPEVQGKYYAHAYSGAYPFTFRRSIRA